VSDNRYATARIALLIALSSLLLGACSTRGPRGIERAELQRSNATLVEKFGDVISTPITFDDSGQASVVIDHTAISSTFAFKTAQGDHQLVQLFALPAWLSFYELQLTSFAMGGLSEPTLYYPKLVFLDSDFKPTRQSKLTDFVFRNVGSQGGVSATYFMNESNRNDTYIAILSETRKSFEEQLSMLQTSSTTALTIPFKGGTFFFPFTTHGNEAPKKMRATEIGYLEVKFTRRKAK
jgi:Maltose operon periplasmic protein precursor (MalM)